VELDLEHVAIGPVYGTTRGEREQVDPEKSFARAHFEQHMKVRGTMRVDGQTYHLEALGLRDHSWGPRYWQAIPWYRWLTCSFSPEFGIMVNVTGRPDGSVAAYAVVARGPERLDQTRNVQLEADIDPSTRRHRSMRAVIELEGERLTVEGLVVGYAPLRNRRAGHVTHIGEGMTEYRCGDAVGLGISEFLDQIQ
jgi:predicted secreted hydrolase